VSTTYVAARFLPPRRPPVYALAMPAARHAIAAALTAALALPAVVRAEPTPPPPEDLAKPDDAPPPPSDAPDYEAARRAYRTAEAAMASGDYAAAARDFGIAYRQSRDPVLFFKIATAFQKAGDCHTAVVYYRRYLAEGKPDASFQARTQAEIAVCGAATATAAPTAPAHDDRASWQRPVAWTAVGMTAALVTAGTVLGMAARSRQSDLEDLLDDAGDQPFAGSARAEYEDLIDEGERFERLSIVALSAAGVTAVAAVLCFALDGDDDDRRGTAGIELSPTVSPDGAGLFAGWSF
jgi:hypothetical protein